MREMKITSMLVKPGSKPGVASVTIEAEIPAKMAGEMTFDMLGVLSLMAEPAKEAAQVADERPTATASPRRRGGSSAGATTAEAPGSTEQTEDTASPAETKSPSEGAPLGRRRVAPLPQESGSAPSSTGDASQTISPNAEQPAPTRRRTTAASAGEQKSSTTSTATAYTNADMTKAASDAAEKIGPAAVKEVIAMFGAQHVGQLDEGQRPAFVEELDRRMAA